MALAGPALLAAEPATAAAPTAPRPVIALNQVGFLTAQPKRFTAPLTPDGTAFHIRRADRGGVLFKGTVTSGIGDFSAFRPADSADTYVAELAGLDRIGAPISSDPFLITTNLWQEQYWQVATDFMVDCRSVTGTHPSAFGGGAWRDSTYYAFEGPSLLLLLAADPARVAAQPRQIDWAADRARVLAPDFPYDAKTPESDGALEATRRYYTEFAPPAADAPDLVKLIHWAYGYILQRPASKDPSGDPAPKKIHSQHVEQFAYLLHHWPLVEKWLPAEFRVRCLEFAFAQWESSGLLAIDPRWDPATYEEAPAAEAHTFAAGYLHPSKGRHAPGHSIAPNLMLYRAALAERRADAPRYLAAAQAQAKWLVEKLDWNDPRTTKGHRMSEFRTMIGLVYFLQHHPEAAPAGLREKIAAWARVAITRSENFWDFRRFDLETHWTIPRINEPGNLLGFTAAALAASWVIDDPALRARLREVGFAQTDAFFGRNPIRAVGVSHPKKSFPEVERAWPIFYKPDTCARLEAVRGSISTNCPTEFYPYNPNSTAYRHPEGWVNFNATWNVALAYAHLDQTGRRP